jgi:hypothetical protein
VSTRYHSPANGDDIQATSADIGGSMDPSFFERTYQSDQNFCRVVVELAFDGFRCTPSCSAASSEPSISLSSLPMMIETRRRERVENCVRCLTSII